MNQLSRVIAPLLRSAGLDVRTVSRAGGDIHELVVTNPSPLTLSSRHSAQTTRSEDVKEVYGTRLTRPRPRAPGVRPLRADPPR
ncbi:MAG TPA: hypothetical protein VG164_02810 [Trebonia sp.]|jgi:hypothetical protein|nr:hypothetical protein [Trebonia sp.]